MQRKYWIIVGVAVGLMLVWLVLWLSLWAPVSFGTRGGNGHMITVKSGESISAIAHDLKQQDLIRSVWGFKVYLKLTGRVIVQPGVYGPLYGNDSLPKIASMIASGSTANVTVTIPEGYSLAQIAETFAAKNIGSVDEFVGRAKAIPNDYEFLKDKPNDVSLEGFLFPDTYRLIKGDVEGGIKMMLDNFGAKYQTDIKAQLGSKNIYQVLIIASLIEKEAKTQADREQVAAVLYNRLDAGMRLDVDATVRYIINDWKKALTKEDLSIDSPYNTRRHGGLPPTPICNPGLAAIKAALNPPESDYLYYLTDYQGITHYAKTLAEHNANKLEYL